MKIATITQLLTLYMGSSLFAISLVENGTRKIIYEKSSDQSTILKTITELHAEGKTVLGILEQELDGQHQEFLVALQSIFATQDEWDAVLDELEMLRSQDTLKAQDQHLTPSHTKDVHPLIAKAQKLMIEAGINPEMVTINLIGNPKRITRAAAGQGYDGQNLTHDLEINLDQIEKHTEEEQEAILKHELVHLLKYDGLEQAAIEAMLERNGISDYSKHPTYSAYCRLQEYRADLLASPDLVAALATLKNLAELMKEYPQFCKKDSIRHPSIEKRHGAVQNLISYLRAEQQIITA